MLAWKSVTGACCLGIRISTTEACEVSTRLGVRVGGLAIGGRTEWIKLEGSVPGLYLCASLPATYPGGLSSKKINPSKEWIILFWGG